MLAIAGSSTYSSKCEKHGLPEESSKRTQTRYRTAEARQKTPYGPLVRDLTIPTLEDDGQSSSVTIAFQDPSAMLHVSCKLCPIFAACLLSAYRQCPCSPDDPWGLILYADEIGHNPLLAVDPRKVQAIYYSYAELGARVLSTESGWFVLATVRSTVVEKMVSGMSHLVRILLREAFF